MTPFPLSPFKRLMAPFKALLAPLRASELAGDTPSRLAMLAALNNTNRHVYAGTVPAAVVATRRRKNRAARKARRRNRG